MEKAIMDGGHSVEDYTNEWPFVKKDENFSFLKELNEARMTRNERDAKVLTYTDCCERTYLSMLILQLFRYYPTYSGVAASYAKRTDDAKYEYFRTHSTDLYNFVYFVKGSNDAVARLKDPQSAKALAQRTNFPVLNFNRFITRLKTAAAGNRNDQEAFIRIESGLNITNTDYKSIRRGLFSWNSLSPKDRERLVTRLLFAARAKLRNSDLIDDFEKLAAEKNLESNTVRDPEPTVSVPDIRVTGEDLVLYRYLVGTRNMALAKKFLELARDNKPIAQQFVQAYLPVIELVDDIVKAGPGYIQMLRSLQKRAKNSTKK
jgi:hypothetical protein